MPLADGLFVISVAAACVIVISLWAAKAYGRAAALVTAALGAVTLGFVWIAYQVWPIESWRSGSLLHTCVVFAAPAAATVLVCVGHKPKVSIRRQIGLLSAFFLGPVLMLYISQLHIGGARRTLPSLSWWALTSILIYILIPVIYAVFARERIRSYGLSLGFIRTEASLLLLTVPVMAVLTWLVAQDARFQVTYPFYLYRPDTGTGSFSELIIFELMYGLTFVALEFYYRGFMVHAGQAVLGVHAVPVMAFFYCLIHLGKPMPECAASLIGGLLLGYVSLRLRSIAVGIAAHLTLAWGVDAAVLARL